MVWACICLLVDGCPDLVAFEPEQFMVAFLRRPVVRAWPD